MDDKWLEDFLSVARTGSFSRSAAERHITQPAFSRVSAGSRVHWAGHARPWPADDESGGPDRHAVLDAFTRRR